MESNKLKHYFVEKSKNTQELLDTWRTNIHPFIIERSFTNYDDIVINERILDDFSEFNNEHIKNDMLHKLAKTLLDQGFIDFSENKNIDYGYTDFSMRIKSIRNFENNER